MGIPNRKWPFGKFLGLAAGGVSLLLSTVAAAGEIVMNVDFCDIIGSKWDAYQKGNAAEPGYTEAEIRAMLHRCRLNGCDAVNWRVASLGVCLHPTKHFADIEFISKWADEKGFVELERRRTEDWMCLTDRFRGSYTATKAACPDTLAVAADACRKEGLKLYFWIDLHDEMLGRFVNEHPECLVRTKDGALYPGVRDYGIEEAVKERILELEELYRYDPDGFYFCTSAHTRHCRFDEPDGAFGMLEADTYTAFLRRVRQSMRPYGFRLIMGTGCAGRLDFCSPYFDRHVKYAIEHDWRTWVDEGLVDGLVCGDYERLLVMYDAWRAKGVYKIEPGRTAADIFLPGFVRYCKGRVKLYGFSDWLTTGTYERTLTSATDMVLGFGLGGLHIQEEMLIDGFERGWDAVRTIRRRFDEAKRADVAENGTTVVWQNTNARITDDAWGMPGLWRDAEGDVLTVAPTNGSDHYAIRLLPVTTEAKPGETNPPWMAGQKQVKQISTGPNAGTGNNTTVSGYSVDPVVDSIGADDIASTYRYAIYLAPYNQEFTWALARSFSVRDPNGFKGLFKSDNANVTWEFRAEPDFTPLAYGIDSAYGPRIRVPTVGTVAQIGGVSRTGGVYKHGAGTLEVLGGGSDGHYIVEEGALRLNGDGATEDGLVKNLLSEALLHLDASDVDSVVTSNAAGHVWFARWDDVRKNGVYAYHELRGGEISQANPAFVSAQISPTGRRLADFGRLAGMAEPGDVTNCYMRLSANFNNVRDAVFVAAFPYGTQFATVLGGTTTYDWMSDNTYGQIFSCGYAPHSVAYGKFAVNGAPCTYDDLRTQFSDAEWAKVNVVHAQPTAETCVDLLGSDRRYVSNHGNSRVGEILLFSRELTLAERTALDRYLVAKWVDGKVRSATGVLLKEGTAVDVAAGAVARVGRVTAADKTVVKTGAGTLEVAEIASDDQVFDVRGGSVRFVQKPVATDRPAGSPYIWLNATDDTTLVTDEKGVTQWKDCRDGSLVATSVAVTSAGAMPTKDAAGCNGLQTLDLGKGTAANGTQSYFTLPNAKGAKDTYAGFMVLKFNDAKHFYMFGSSNIDFYRTTGKIGNGDETGAGAYVRREVSAAYWSLNGTQRSPFDVQDELGQTAEYFVIGFRSAVPLTCDRIAVDRDLANTCGNLRVGEFITYHEPISQEEFNQTEAYLMKKWLNRTHPANRTAVGGLKFADGADKVIDTDCDLTVPLPSGAGSKIVKKGAGALTLTVRLDDKALPAIEVQEGTVDVVYDRYAFGNRALFHFDASDLSTMTYTVVNGETNVQYIADIRKNGVRGRSASDAGHGPAWKDPQLKTATMKAGVTRPVLDFFKTWYKGQPQEDAAALLLQKDGENHVFGGIREVFFVIAQNADTSGTLMCDSWFSASFTAGVPLKWGRNTYADPDVLIPDLPQYVYPGFYNEGSASIDGVDGKATELMFGSADGFKLIELRPGEDADAAVFSAERKDYAAGGYQLGEMMAFPRELTADERMALRTKLRGKWFGEETPPLPELTSLTLTVGQTISIADVMLSADVALKVEVPDRHDLESGTYTLLTSERGFAPSGTSGWTVTVDNRSGLRVGTVWIDGKDLKVRLGETGLLINIQ